MFIAGRRGAAAPRAAAASRQASACLVLCVVLMIGGFHPPGATAEELPPPEKTAGVDLQNPEAIAKGMEMLNTTCGGYCHGPGGRGFKAPSLRNRTDLSTGALHAVISYGRKRAGKLMPAWKGTLSEEQIWSAVAAIVSLRDAPQDELDSPGGSGH